MSILGIILAMVIVGATGCLIGFFLCFSSERFKVEVDERETAILDVLPGNNCGGCGYAGCSGLAAAIVKGDAPVNQCPVGGDEVAAKVGEIMGVSAEAGTKMMAFVKCSGTCEKAKDRYKYTGITSCSSMAFVPAGGPKACTYGCLGFGDCVNACPFDAIHVIDGIAQVDPEACKACGKCVDACPRGMIELIPYPVKKTVAVACKNQNKGKAVMEVCDVGCIGCGLCEKNCPKDAIHVVDNIAHVDQEKCIGCTICAQKCPKKVISVIEKKG